MRWAKATSDRGAAGLRAARCPRRHAIVPLETLKYSAHFPDRFGWLENGKRFCREFFAWYNTVHRHSGIAMLTPATVHHDTADFVLDLVTA